MKEENVIYRIINGKGENRRLDRRYVILGMFIFVMVATFSFLLTRNMENTSAVDLSGFKAGNIISDAVMRDYASMSENEIQSFLKSKNSCNDKKLSKSGNNISKYSEMSPPLSWHVDGGHYVCLADEKINGETAAHIIYQTAQDYKINPKVLIVLLEKEQGLITDTFPNSFQYRSATGYGCPDTAACSSKYYGLKNQIRNAAALFDTVLSGGWTNYPVGWNNIRYSPNAACGSSKVYVENLATSALYRYTPYQPNEAALRAGPGSGAACGAYGNRNFYIYFTEWFGSTQTISKKVPSAIMPSDEFTLQNKDGKYIIPEENKQSSELVLSANATKEQRTFKLTRDGDYYTITHVKSGLVLDVAGANAIEGKVQLYASNGTNAQKWRITRSGDKYTIRSALIDNKVINTSDKKINLDYFVDSATEKVTMKNVSTDAIGKGPYVPVTTGGKAMDIDGARTDNGTKLLTWNLNYSTHQQYTFSRDENGFYTITNVHSGKVLDVAGASTANGAAVQIYTSNNTCAQKWVIEKSGDGYRILSACSGKAIDVSGNAVSENLKVLQIYTANGTNAQVWKLNKLPVEEKKSEEKSETKQALENGTYKIYSSVGNNVVLDIYGSTARRAENGSNVQIYNNINVDTHEFKVTYNKEKDVYSIVTPYLNRSIDVAGANMNNSTNIQLYDSNNTCAQLWKITKNSDNTYTIASSCSNKMVLDVAGGSAANKTNVQLYTSNGTKAQKWTFKKL